MNRVTEGYKAFAQLEPQWEAIADAGGLQTPFQSFAWIDQWLRHRGNGVEPFALVVQDGATIAPFGIFRVAGTRVLRLLGTGDSDYPGLVTASPADEAWDMVARELARRRGTWDLLHLHSVRNSEVIVAALERNIGTTGCSRLYDVCPWVPTDQSWKSLLASRRKKLRYVGKRWTRQVEARGEVSVEVVGPPVSEALINELVDVERASWKWDLGEAVLKPGAQRDFLEAILQDSRMEQQLWLLRISSQLVAFTHLVEPCCCGGRLCIGHRFREVDRGTQGRRRSWRPSQRMRKRVPAPGAD